MIRNYAPVPSLMILRLGCYSNLASYWCLGNSSMVLESRRDFLEYASNSFYIFGICLEICFPVCL
jgi:hypothetical protein